MRLSRRRISGVRSALGLGHVFDVDVRRCTQILEEKHPFVLMFLNATSAGGRRGIEVVASPGRSE
jgi:hypothetical protein